MQPDEVQAKLGGTALRIASFFPNFTQATSLVLLLAVECFRKNPHTGDRRISGTTASLAGLEAAIKTRNEKAISLAIERILLGHALILGYDGIPLIYMGDELGYLNDYGFSDNPDHATDNRWLHPRMNWEKADHRKLPGSIEHRIFQGLATLIGAREASAPIPLRPTCNCA